VSQMPDFSPERILEILIEHDVQFVMIGGLAAALHGSEIATVDLDITPLKSHDNLAKLSSALTQLHARIRTEGVDGGLPFAHTAMSLAAAGAPNPACRLDKSTVGPGDEVGPAASDNGVWNLLTDFGDLDISFVPSGTEGYAEGAIAIEIFGFVATVASLADIIRSKEAAGRPKDLIAVPHLRRLLAQLNRE
jgi:hypothetical protein